MTTTQAKYSTQTQEHHTSQPTPATATGEYRVSDSTDLSTTPPTTTNDDDHDDDDGGSDVTSTIYQNEARTEMAAEVETTTSPVHHGNDVTLGTVTETSETTSHNNDKDDNFNGSQGSDTPLDTRTDYTHATTDGRAATATTTPMTDISEYKNSQSYLQDTGSASQQTTVSRIPPDTETEAPLDQETATGTVEDEVQGTKDPATTGYTESDGFTHDRTDNAPTENMQTVEAASNSIHTDRAEVTAPTEGVNSHPTTEGITITEEGAIPAEPTQDSMATAPTEHMQSPMTTNAERYTNPDEDINPTLYTESHMTHTMDDNTDSARGTVPTEATEHHMTHTMDDTTDSTGGTVPTEPTENHMTPTMDDTTDSAGGTVPTEATEHHMTHTMDDTTDSTGGTVPTEPTENHMTPTMDDTTDSAGGTVPTEPTEHHMTPTMDDTTDSAAQTVPTEPTENHVTHTVDDTTDFGEGDERTEPTENPKTAESESQTAGSELETEPTAIWQSLLTTTENIFKYFTGTEEEVTAAPTEQDHGAMVTEAQSEATPTGHSGGDMTTTMTDVVTDSRHDNLPTEMPTQSHVTTMADMVTDSEAGTAPTGHGHNTMTTIDDSDAQEKLTTTNKDLLLTEQDMLSKDMTTVDEDGRMVYSFATTDTLSTQTAGTYKSSVTPESLYSP